MNIKSLALITCSIAVLLSGCSSPDDDNPETMVETKALQSGDYGAALPFQSTTARQQHQIRNASLVDNLYIGTGLLNYAKGRFSPSSYTIQEGQFLVYDELDNLLSRESDSNPDALNPANDAEFETGKGIVKGAVLVQIGRASALRWCSTGWSAIKILRSAMIVFKRLEKKRRASSSRICARCRKSVIPCRFMWRYTRICQRRAHCPERFLAKRILRVEAHAFPILMNNG